MGLVIKPTGRRIHLWRFMDDREDRVDLQQAHRYLP
jgi:hypothetical protein